MDPLLVLFLFFVFFFCFHAKVHDLLDFIFVLFCFVLFNKLLERNTKKTKKKKNNTIFFLQLFDSLSPNLRI